MKSKAFLEKTSLIEMDKIRTPALRKAYLRTSHLGSNFPVSPFLGHVEQNIRHHKQPRICCCSVFELNCHLHGLVSGRTTVDKLVTICSIQSLYAVCSPAAICSQCLWSEGCSRVGKLDKILNHDKQMGDEEKIRYLRDEFVHRELPERLQRFLSDIHLLFALHFCSRYSLMWCHNCVEEHHLTHHSKNSHSCSTTQRSSDCGDYSK